MCIKKLIRRLFKGNLEEKEYYKKEENIIRRSLTDKLGRTYIASNILTSKKE